MRSGLNSNIAHRVELKQPESASNGLIECRRGELHGLLRKLVIGRDDERYI